MSIEEELAICARDLAALVTAYREAEQEWEVLRRREQEAISRRDAIYTNMRDQRIKLMEVIETMATTPADPEPRGELVRDRRFREFI